MIVSFSTIHLLLGQSEPAASAATPLGSVWDLMIKGGPVMIPIGICSLVAMAIVVERMLVLRRGAIIPSGLMDRVKSALGSAGGGRTAALDLCQTSQSPLGDILAVGIRRLSEPLELLERHVQDAGERAVAQLRRRLRALTLIASISPLLGLLGTIFGMIEAFQTVATSKDALGKTELLASGIYEAMITTAAGLCVAIPVIICYHWISARIDGLVEEIDRQVVGFVEDVALANRMPEPTNGAKHHSESGGNGSGAAAVEPAAAERLTVGERP